MLLATLGTGVGQPCSINITNQPQSQASCIGAIVTLTVGDGRDKRL